RVAERRLKPGLWTAATCRRSCPGTQAVPNSRPAGRRQPTGALRGRDRSADLGSAAGLVRRYQSGSKLPHSTRWRALLRPRPRATRSVWTAPACWRCWMRAETFSFSGAAFFVNETGVYLEYYGLKEPPFELTPNPRFLFF